jgi:hypothetical protein
MIIQQINRIALITCICLGLKCHGQVNYKVDTLNYSYRIGGALNSVDQIIGFQSNTLPGGGWNSIANIFSNGFWYLNPSGMQFFNFHKPLSIKFSGLPHIGFAYSFGSSGSQFAQAEYQQKLQNGLLINLDFNKLRSNGMLRSGGFNHTNTALQLYKSSKIWTTYLSSTFATSDVSLNNGLLIDSLNNAFSLQFIPIRKENANALTQRTSVDWWNYFDLNEDSIKSLGIYVNNTLKIKKFVYSEESDTLAQLYSQINLDSSQTYDQFQWSNTGIGVGTFLSSKNYRLTAGVDFNYWNFQNLGLFRDSVEINLIGNYKSLFTDNYYLMDSMSLNLYGAGQGFHNNMSAGITLSDNWTIGTQILFDKRLADYHQRYAYGNNYKASFDSIRQSTLLIASNLGVQFDSFGIKLGVNYNANYGNFWFVDNAWNNDSINYLNFYGVYLKMRYNVQKISAEAYYQFSYSSASTDIKYLPSHLLNVRMCYTSKVFKAQKMLVYTGIDFAFVSQYERIGFLPNVLSWDVSNSYGLGPAYTNLHWFGGFQIDEFRFFIRAENIGSFWTDRNIQVQNDYPIGGLQLRVGITWDFFN